MMRAALEETNVIVPDCAMNALQAIAGDRRQSRDQTVRQLLDDHLDRQERRKPGDRLTHISTVLRYPPAPRHRRQPRVGTRLRLRLPLGTTQRARAVSLRLPGQLVRAQPDYQARQLTDAVVTAIAAVRTFSDDFLDGLPPLLRHHTAIRMWQAAVAATCTEPERVLLNEAYDVRLLPPAEQTAADERLLRVADALETDVAWHSQQRFDVAAELARAWLRDASREARVDLDQFDDEEWGEELYDLRNPYGGASSGYDWSGRGASAVWRARRRVEIDEFEQWLLKHTEPAESEVYRLTPPGWLVRLPAGWCTQIVSDAVVEPFASWLGEGRLLTFSSRGQSAVWPLRTAATALGWEPIPGLEPVIAATAKLPSTKITTFLEAVLLVWDAEDPEHQEALQPPLQIFVDKAAEFGFIDAADVLAIRAQARSQTLQRMQAIVDELPDEYAVLRPELAASVGKTREFTAIAKDAGITFQATRATWAWPLTTVVEEAISGQRADAAEWLAREVHRVCNSRLQRAMEAAWRQAFDHSPKGVWLREHPTAAPPTTRVTPTNTEPFEAEFILGPEPPF